MNKEVTPLSREAKILLLNILKKGYFDKNDMELLSKVIVFNIPVHEWINIHNPKEQITIEVIDRREQVKH
jgi:hypothetical protein